MTSNEEYNVRMLKQYFNNIILACDNKSVDERPYIKSVAESGIYVVNQLLK